MTIKHKVQEEEEEVAQETIPLLASERTSSGKLECRGSFLKYTDTSTPDTHGKQILLAQSGPQGNRRSFSGSAVPQQTK